MKLPNQFQLYSIGWAAWIALWIGVSCTRESVPPPSGGDDLKKSHEVFSKPGAECAPCHETSRPASVNYPPPNTAPIIGHFETQDCSQCHESMANVSSFSFTHQNAQGSIVSTCLPCHEARRPSPTHNTGRDCVECHASPSKPWGDSGYTHTVNGNPVTSCSNCHLADRPALNQIFPISGQNDYTHGRGEHESYDCASCHSRAGVSWIILNPEDLCARCHD